MDERRPTPPRAASTLPPAQVAKAALHRLALSKQEPTPENYAAAYAAESGGGPAPAEALPERVQRQALNAAQQVYRFAQRQPAPAHLALLREAAWAEQAVIFTYADLGGSVTRREVWPLSVVWLDHSLLLLAWCCLRQDFRRFKLEAMADVALAPGSFRPRRVALLRAFHKILRGEG